METRLPTTYVAGVTIQPVASNPSVFVRPATASDVTFLTDVVLVATRSQGRLPADFDEPEYRAGFGEWTAGQIAGQIAGRLTGLGAGPNPCSVTSVIEIDGARAGRQRVVRTPDHLELAGIQLLPAHQGHGLGTYLIEQFLLDARRAGVPARITVENDNPRARALYERLGFVAVAGSDDETTLEWPAP